MRRLQVEQLEDRSNPVAVSLDPGNVLSVVLDAGAVSSVSVDTADEFSTRVSVDGAQAGLALTNPEGLPRLSVVIDGSLTAKAVIQNNTNLSFGAAGGVGPDVLFGGSGFNFLFGGPGLDVIYAILPSATDVIEAADGEADRVFVNANPANNVNTDGPVLDPVVTFFRPDRLPGSGVIRQEADGVLYVAPSNNGSVVTLDEPAPGVVVADYDLGDGNGPRRQQFLGVVAVSYFGGGGMDVYVNNTSVREAAYGSAGTDYLLGGFGDVSILKGLGGADQVLARTGGYADLSGNGGSDVVVQFGPGTATFRVSPDDEVVAGFKTGDVALSP